MIKAIETEYKGYRFRSRLEARWAVFLDVLGIEWEYEKEGFDLEGDWYLPDFWLENVSLRGHTPGMWLEIKGQQPKEQEMILGELLGRYTQHGTALAVGLPSQEQRPDGIFELWPTHDNWLHFMRCYHCDFTKIEFLESNYCTCPNCGEKADDEHPAIPIAADIAKGARFEHSEKPYIPSARELQNMCIDAYLDRAEQCLKESERALRQYCIGSFSIEMARRPSQQAVEWMDLAKKRRAD